MFCIESSFVYSHLVLFLKYFSPVFGPTSVVETMLGSTTTRKKKSGKNRSIKDTRNYVKNPNRKNP